MARDFYEILGIGKEASSEDIKKAYRRMAKQYHPDTNKDAGAADKFREAAEAYAILNDPDKRARYDRFGHQGVQDSGFGAGGFDVNMSDIESIFGDLFSAAFGGQAGGRRANGRKIPRQGRDMRYEMTLTFEESIFGLEREIDITRMETCETCNGTGGEPGNAPRDCLECAGTGEKRNYRQSFMGTVVEVAPCPRCSGTGKIIDAPCKTCKGATQVRKTHKLKVTVPGGVDESTQLTVAGEGEPGEFGGPHGNLRLTFKIQPHEFFRRKEHDILLNLHVNIAQAALGAEVSVPTVDGPQTLSIPAGTQSGKVFTIKNKGAPKVRSDGTSIARGDQLVYVQVVVPTRLTPDQKRLIEDLGRTLDSTVQPQKAGKGFFDRVLEFFGGDSR